ncbi:neuronal acetylcholine receptor subunit alpha-5-like [Diadema antillarum]|uniref:neuronal acetylcholine receptor subunit alpha-5-like n=1 Tax=Diadema antillarum TaxID=105358 RepID=UPI003A861401
MESVWTPPMLIFNSIASHSAESPLQPGASKVAVNQDGSAQIQTSLLHSTTCDINLRAFPFDSHVCVVIFASQGLRSDIFKFEPAQVLSLDDTYPQWLLTALSADAVEESDQLHNETFSFLNVRFTLERLPDFFLRMVAAPLQLLNALALITFLIPLKSGERVSSCLSLVLGQTVFHIIIADILPRTSRADSEPILINFVLSSFLNLVCITAGSAMTVNLSFQSWRIRNRTSRYIVFHVLAAIALMKLPQSRCKNDASQVEKMSRKECKQDEVEKSSDIPLDTGDLSSPREEMTDMEFLAACLDRIFSFCALIAFLLPNIAAFEIVKNSLRIMVR